MAIYRIGEVQGRPYIASEYVQGTSLDRVPKPQPWTRLLSIATALARGLAEAHRRGVLHRDVKPANVILADDGAVKLVDFGLAKLDEIGGASAARSSRAPASVAPPSDPIPTLEPSSELEWAVAPAERADGAPITVVDSPEAVSQTLPAAGAFARGIGNVPRHLLVFGETLLEALAGFEGGHWDERTASAWREPTRPSRWPCSKECGSGSAPRRRSSAVFQPNFP